jgi:hypothetical protein
MRPAETIPGVGRGEIKETDGRGEFKYKYCKNFGKCHNVFPVQHYFLPKKK